MNSGVSVVALTNVKQTGDTVDITKLQLVELKLAAGQGQDQAILRYGLCELLLVGTLSLVAVTAADQEEVLDIAGLNRINNRRCCAHQGIAGKAG